MSKFHPDNLTDEQCLSGVSWETYNKLYELTESMAKSLEKFDLDGVYEPVYKALCNYRRYEDE